VRHPWLADGAYITVCPVCGLACEGASEDERGTLYTHARRDYPCRLAHRLNESGVGFDPELFLEALRLIEKGPYEW